MSQVQVGFHHDLRVLSLIGLVGTIFWLLYAKKPVVDVHELKDKNFALGSVCVVGFAAILYGSAVLVPQLAQQQLGYTATLAGLVSSLGAMMIAAIIPAVSKLMPIIQTRYLVGFGFFLTACALFYKRPLLPNIDGKTLAIMRSSQSIAIAFLPITTLAYLTLKASENADASAFFHNVPQRGGALRRRAKKRWYLGRRGCGYSVRTRAINASNWA
jgi:DHA2 family multidrug resistance protein